MIFKTGDTLLSRYRLVTPVVDKPGISAWHARDQILAQDCQLFVTNQVSAAPTVQSLASWLGSTRNPRFTQVQHLHAENSVCVIVTDVDGGMSLSDYLATDAPLSTDAMRTIMGEVATAALDMDKVGIEHKSLTSEFIRLSDKAVTVADLPISPLFVAPSLGLQGDSAHSALARTLRELGMLLYQMITRMPYIPGQTVSASTLDAARIALPDEFRILCTRTLGLKEEDEAEPPIPMVTVDEFRDLLEPWKPMGELTQKDIVLPSAAVSESVQDARIVSVPDDDLVPVPKSIMSFNPHTQRPDWESALFFQPDRVQAVPATGTAMFDEFAITMGDSSTQMPAITETTPVNSKAKMGPVPIDPANPPVGASKPTVALDVSDLRKKKEEKDVPRTLGSAGANVRSVGNDPEADKQDESSQTTSSDESEKESDDAPSPSDTARRTARPSVIPPTQPVALSSTLPNRSLADLERRTADARKATQPQRIPPENDVEESSSSLTFTDNFVDGGVEEKKGPNVAVVVLIVIIAAMIFFAISVATGLFQGTGNFRFGGGSTNAWPTDVPNATWPKTETAAPEETQEVTPTPTETPTPTPTVTNTQPYALSWSYIGKQTGTDGVAGWAFIVTLKQEQPVSRVVLTSPSVGGTVYVYANSTAQNPQNGSPVGSATFSDSGTTTIDLNATTNTQSLSIWISQNDFPTNKVLRMNGITVY